MFDLVDSSIRRSTNSIVSGNFFQLERFILGFCLEIEKFRVFELGSVIFISEKQNCEKS